MGIESDQLVFDYLSRVGDLAQRQQLPSQARMRLVASLRGEIEQRRAKSDSPEAVRRILTRLGTPDEVVAAASSGQLSVPPQRTAKTPDPAGSPHLAGTDEVGSGDVQPDWWRVEDVPAGFHGGVEIPEMLKPPAPEDPEDPDAPEGTEDPEAPEASDAAAKARRLPRLRLRRRTPPEAAPAAAAPAAAAVPVKAPARIRNPFLLLAAALLLVGAVLGSWYPLAGGWLLAYGSRRLSRTEAKWAVMWLPGLVAAGAAVWLWGRTEGRWGEPLAAGAMGEAVSETWPWVVRGAALASALFLAWRSRRA
ncbi:hypothetical protein AB0A69_09280 [Streptomyces sp. NPDC045431]|uniref:hypothetical protein n=1 Tax=Streptomyces sp. NPDC045431 TaxID=3155613 RepID=UPI0033E1E98B